MYTRHKRNQEETGAIVSGLDPKIQRHVDAERVVRDQTAETGAPTPEAERELDAASGDLLKD